MESTQAAAPAIGTKATHSHYGRGIIVEVMSEAYSIWFKSQGAVKTVSKDFAGLQVSASAGGENSSSTGGGNVSLAEVEDALERILDRRLHDSAEIVPL